MANRKCHTRMLTRRPGQPRSGCAINAAMEVIGDRWSLLVLRDGRARKVAIVTLAGCLQSVFGYPNDEARWNDPRAAAGDRPGYGFCEVLSTRTTAGGKRSTCPGPGTPRQRRAAPRHRRASPASSPHPDAGTASPTAPGDTHSNDPAITPSDEDATRQPNNRHPTADYASLADSVPESPAARRTAFSGRLRQTIPARARSCPRRGSTSSKLYGSGTVAATALAAAPLSSRTYHIIPFAMGGATSAENLQILCGPLTDAKGPD